MASIKEGMTELRHLRYFLAVAEARNFRRAAEGLYLSQPTLSHQIKQLELQVGAALFERLSRTVRLTPAGEVLKKRALVMMRELEDAKREIAELQALEAGELRIGIVSTVNVAVVPEAVGTFRNLHPKVSVAIRELPMEALEAELLAGGLDLGISFLPPKSGVRLEVEPLFVERLVAVMPENHRLRKKRRIVLSDVLAEPLVLLSHGYCTRELVIESAALQGLEQILKPAIEMNSIDGVLATLRQTGMVTLLPDAAVRWENHPDLAVRSLGDAHTDLSFRKVGLLWVAGGHRGAAACAFAKEVRAIFHAKSARAGSLRSPSAG